MHLIAIVDENLGMAFNRRRQSRDRLLTARICALAGEHTLWLSPYSLTLFDNSCRARLCADEQFLERARPGELCLTELTSPAQVQARVERLTLFRWNRSYPADVQLGLSLERGWRLISREEFAGASHPRITQEAYERV